MTPGGPLLNLIALVLPVGGAVYAWLVMEEKPHGGNMGAAIGGALARYFVFAAACLLGVVAGVAAFVRGERPGWLTVCAMLLNIACAILPPLWFFLGKPR